MTETSYHADPASVVFAAPQAELFGLIAPAFAAPESGSLLAGINWRHAGELCPSPVNGSQLISVQGTKGRTGDVRRIAAFAIKHDVPGLTAWSPPI